MIAIVTLVLELFASRLIGNHNQNSLGVHESSRTLR